MANLVVENRRVFATAHVRDTGLRSWDKMCFPRELPSAQGDKRWCAYFQIRILPILPNLRLVCKAAKGSTQLGPQPSGTSASFWLPTPNSDAAIQRSSSRGKD